MSRLATIAARSAFWAKVEKTDDCWAWTAARTPRGYGKVGIGGGRTEAAHRCSYEFHFGPIPAGLWVLHRCDNPPCVRPSHLFVGTPSDNYRDMVSKGRAALQGPRGSLHPGAVLDEDRVLAIRERFASGAKTADLSAEAGVPVGTIVNAIKGVTWRHVGGPTPPSVRRRRGEEDMSNRGRSGSRNAAAKVDEAAVREIRGAYADGQTQRQIADRYGLSRSAVGLIVTGRLWAHVDGPLKVRHQRRNQGA